MMIVMLVITILVTIASGIISAYAMHITSQVSGEKLLTLDSTLGYKYATTYHTWQITAMISVGVALLLWVLLIVVLVKRQRKKKRERQQNMNSEV